MVAFKIHKWAGIFIGFWLLNLSVTGFFLNHEKNSYDFDFLWEISIPASLFNEYSLNNHRYREVNSYKAHPEKGWKLIGSMRGLFISKGREFKKVFSGRVFDIEPFREDDFNEDFSTVYIATERGIYRYDWNKEPELIGLKGKIITSISVLSKKIIAVEQKKKIWLLDLKENSLKELRVESIKSPQSVSLMRFVRDFHYGRGLFKNPLSMLLNDLFSLWWSYLTLSGTLVFFLYRRLKVKRKGRDLLLMVIRTHSNYATIFIIPFIFLLALTGLIIDHPNFFRKFVSFSIPVKVMPPIYHNPGDDIWGIDFDGRFLRIGTRYGVFVSEDFRSFSLESEGFAYKVIRVKDTLFVSGMGSPSRFLKEGRWISLEKTHMPIDFLKTDKGVFPVMRKDIPVFSEKVPLYTLLLSLHDGSFFHKHFIFLNDMAAILTFLLLITGTIRFLKRKRYRKRVH